jgi:hypothetical protein
VLLYYSLGAAAMLALIAADLYFLETVLWKKIAALTAASLVLPQVSIDYHMINIYLPLYLFANDKSKASNSKSDLIYTIVFGLLLIPKNYFLIANYSIAHWSETGFLLLLLGMIIAENMLPKYVKPAKV